MFGFKTLPNGTPKPESVTETPNAAKVGGENALLSREAVFDRHNRLTGHLFRLRQSSHFADAAIAEQRLIDQQLLSTLISSDKAWNRQTAFVPINSISLDLPELDKLPWKNLVLLVQLAAEHTDPEPIIARIAGLRLRGLAIGLFHQPGHPIYDTGTLTADYGVVDSANNLHELSNAFLPGHHQTAATRFAININTPDDHLLCQQWHFDLFHGSFASNTVVHSKNKEVDPHKLQLLNLFRLVQGDAETPAIVDAMKQDPVLVFRILRYLNSPALGLNHRIDSISQALIILGRQRLGRWLSVLLFSVNGGNCADWLLAETALTRGRLMEELGALARPNLPADPLFLTGIFSCLDRLLHRPLAEIMAEIPLSKDISSALLERNGPFVPFLAIAEACDDHDEDKMLDATLAAGLKPESISSALLTATAWASEITEDAA